MSISSITSSTGLNYDSTAANELAPVKREQNLNTEVNTGTVTGQSAKVSDGSVKVSTSESGSTVEVSQNGDTVEISESGMSKAQDMVVPVKAASANPSTQASTGTSQTSAASQTLKSAAQTIKSATQTVTSSSTSESSSSANLSQYSEYQLKQMLSKGVITRAQYEVEIASREKAAKSSDSNTGKEQKIDTRNQSVKITE